MSAPSRRPFTRLLVAVMAFLVGVPLALVAEPQPAAADEGSYEVTEGTFDWGLSGTYRNYVPGTPEGRVALSDGLTENADGTYRWAVESGSFDPESGALDLRLRGTVNFYGHSGQMDLTLSDLHLVADGYGSSTLYADYSSVVGGETLVGDDVSLADISASTGGSVSVPEDALEWSSIYTTLASGAVPAFAGYYSTGQLLDPVSLSLVGEWPAAAAETWDEEGTAAVSVAQILPPSGATWNSLVVDRERGLAFGATSRQEIHVIDVTTRETVQVVSVGATTAVRAVNGQTGEVVVRSASSLRLLSPQGDGSYALADALAGGATQSVAVHESTGDIVVATGSSLVVNSRGVDGVYASRTLSGMPGTPIAFNQVTGSLYAVSGTTTYVYDGNSFETAPLRTDVADVQQTALGADPDSGDVFVLSMAYGATWGAAVPRATIYRDDAPLAEPLSLDAAAADAVYDSGRDLLALVTTTPASVTFYDAADRSAVPTPLATGTLDATGLGNKTSTLRSGIDESGNVWAPYPGAILVSTLSTTPVFAAGPSDTVVTVEPGQQTATFEASVEVEGEGVSLQWQRKAPGDVLYRDVADATADTLVADATAADSGTQYRVVASNSAGRVVSAAATLTVQVAPSVATHPQSVSVVDGGVVEFTATGDGNPAPAQDWEIDTGSGWQRVEYSDVVSVFGDTLTIEGVDASLDGVQYRAVFTSAAGTAYSDPATLTVTARPGGPADTTTYTGVAFEWTGSAEWQAQPPNGSAAHYFSAGASDGTQRTYSATKGGVEIVQRTSSGEKPATYATRGAHVNVDGASQVVRLTEGTATIEPDGSALIEWPATFSVNFYDGLVPSTLSNLVLTVDADGAGTLSADLSGYQGDIANPNAPKEAVAPASDVTVATFQNVTVDTENGFTVRPDYRNVRITAPAGETAQNTTVSGWGAWPQEFVTFHGATGLAGYFYSTGGSLDAKKAPNAFAIGFDGATPEVPAEPQNPGEENGGTETPGKRPESPTKPTPEKESGVVEGSLVWGVKESFRTYVEGSIAQGEITVSGGAERVSGVFWFGQDDTSWTSGSTKSSTTYAGDVRFSGHGGVLDLTFSDPVVRIDSASKGSLLVTVNGSRVAMGTLDLSAASKAEADGGIAYSNVPVSLTAAGAQVFSYNGAQFYTAGTALDNASFVIGAKATTPPDDGDVEVPATPQDPDEDTETPGETPGTPQRPGPDDDGVVEGSLVWGVKDSFRDYVENGVAQGEIAVSDGAERVSGVFWFGQSATDWTSGSASSATSYAGAVRFSGHEGVLDLTFSDPIVRIDSASEGALLVRVDGGDPVEIGTLDLAAAGVAEAEGGIAYSDVPVTLTEAGADVFSYDGARFYEPGTGLDAASFVIGETATEPPSDDGVEVPQSPGGEDGDDEPNENAVPETPDSDAEQGSLVWGVKESFRTYIETGVAQGRITVSGGAERLSSGVFWWGQESTDWTAETGTGSTSYTGDVSFWGHEGVLDLTFSDPIVRVDSAERATLLLQVSGGTPVEVATLDLAAATRSDVDGGVSYANAPVTLTESGASVFAWGTARFYEAGTAMDPASFVVGSTATERPDDDTAAPQDDTRDGDGEGGQDAPALVPENEDGVVEGSLVWGVKESFRSYITGSIAKGSISVSNGASVLGGLYWFGQSSTDWTAEAGTGTTGYQGAVRFTGHSGILDLTFANPQVRIDSAGSGALTVTVNGSPVEVGSLDLAAAARTDVEGGVSYSHVPVTLTSAGARVFSYGSSQFYAAGTAMDPLSFVVGSTATSGSGGGSDQTVAAHEETSWTPPAEPPANTGLYIDPETLKDIRPGTEITVIGEGYEPNETDIKVVLYSDPVVLEEDLTADARGRAEWTGIVPLDTEIGEHTLTFQAESQDLGIEFEVLEPEELVGCAVTDAVLDWGFKESFRSYISGSIAHGEWTVSDGATYETPEFGWSDGEGAFDAETFTGQVGFDGTVRFTGHDGLLDTTVSNPTVLFTGRDTAYLLLDVTGVTMEDALAGETDNALAFDQVSFVKLDLAAGDVEISEDGSEITASEVPAAITSQGYEAFPNYEAGTAFDPVSFSITTETDCAVAVPEDEAADVAAAVEAPDADDTDLTWLAWTGGGVALAALVAALAIWLARRRRAEAENGEPVAAGTDPFDEVLGGGR
ncbi:HtaA domain-containing protein [Microbacterium betulae]|uniref:HtaA domain-containing protein n=1 Tax=Microbacterium betulae TaxID=2981139 RepID=A0AA97FGZ9_9MICO|nr:HtaA domain-containing protein [Microbacterium sp. AB]WOF22825.1 HtaA domain-containing protein [Microbacterium sp. AB]